MRESYIHAKINAKAEGGSAKAVLVIMDGVKKWIAYSKMVSIDIKGRGTVTIEDFKKGLKISNDIFIESIEMDKWLATEIHELEVVE